MDSSDGTLPLDLTDPGHLPPLPRSPTLAPPPPIYEIRAYGTPVPQGSKTARPFGKTGKWGVVEANKTRLIPWRDSVAEAAFAVREALGLEPLDEPVVVTCVFTVKKPGGAPKRKVTYPATAPDLDKLIRAVGDSLTAAGVLKDDGRIQWFHSAGKVYPREHPDALDTPGVLIRVWRAHDYWGTDG